MAPGPHVQLSHSTVESWGYHAKTTSLERALQEISTSLEPNPHFVLLVFTPELALFNRIYALGRNKYIKLFNWFLRSELGVGLALD